MIEYNSDGVSPTIKIKGYVYQIIPPDEQKHYMLEQWAVPILDGKYYISVVKEDYPRRIGPFKKLKYFLNHRKETYCWHIALDKIDFKEGDLIEIECKKYYRETELYMGV